MLEPWARDEIPEHGHDWFSDLLFLTPRLSPEADIRFSSICDAFYFLHNAWRLRANGSVQPDLIFAARIRAQCRRHGAVQAAWNQSPGGAGTVLTAAHGVA